MREPSFADSFEVLRLQAVGEGRGPVLFGDCAERVRTEVPPFLVGPKFPQTYFEFPLVGDPYLDVTLLYGELDRGTCIASPAAEGTEEMLDWFADSCNQGVPITCGFELDTKNPQLPAAGVHFQPRTNHELVEPFCAAIGEPERARLYLDLAKRMPSAWPLSFFGLFRGRLGSPLRVCGYLDNREKRAMADDCRHLAQIFDEVGFGAYDDELLAQASRLVGVTPGQLDFQFDVYPDGSIGDTFAFDLRFDLSRAAAVHASFADGPAALIMELLQQWRVADERWKLAVEATIARSIPVELADGTAGRYGFSLIPLWAKVRWRAGVLQPAKLYLLAGAGVV